MAFNSDKYSQLKYLWFRISYEQFSLNNIFYFCNRKFYFPEGTRGGGGGLISLMLYGREDEIFQNQKNLILTHRDDIKNDRQFRECIFTKLLGQCRKIYMIKQDQELKELINSF